MVAVLLVSGCGHRPWVKPSNDWKQVDSANFVVFTDSDPDDFLPVIARLEDVHAALSAFFLAGARLPPSRVLLFESKSDFEAVAPEDVAGFFMHGSAPEEGLMVFYAGSLDAGVLEGIAAHELAHHFIAVVGGAPDWLNEGFAEYVASVELLGEQAVFDMRTLGEGLVLYEEPVPLPRLLSRPFPSSAASGRTAYYMTSWMLMRLFFSHRDGHPLERFKQLVGAVATCGDVSCQAQALSAGMGGAPLAQLDRTIYDIHRRIYHGLFKPESRRTLSVRLPTVSRQPPREHPADRDFIRNLCAALREGRS